MADPKEGFITLGLDVVGLQQFEKVGAALEKIKTAEEGIKPTEGRITLTLDDDPMTQGLLQAARRMRSFIDTVRAVRGELVGLSDAAREAANRAREALPIGQKFPAHLQPGRVAGVLGPLYGITEEDAVDIYNRNKLKRTVTKFAGLLDKAEYTETIQKQINEAQSMINRLSAQVLGISGPVLPTGLITQENAAPAQTAALNLLPRLDIEEEVALYRAALRKVAQRTSAPGFEEFLPPELLEISQRPKDLQLGALSRIGRKYLPRAIPQAESDDEVTAYLRERYGKLPEGAEIPPVRQVLSEAEEDVYPIPPPSRYRAGPRVEAARYRQLEPWRYVLEALGAPTQLPVPAALGPMLGKLEEVRQLPQKAEGFGSLYDLNPALVKSLETALRVGGGRLSGSYTPDLDRLARALLAHLPREAFERPGAFPNLAKYSAEALTAGLGGSGSQEETIQKILLERGIKKPLFELPRSTPYPIFGFLPPPTAAQGIVGTELPPEVVTEASGQVVPESTRKRRLDKYQIGLSGAIPMTDLDRRLIAETGFAPLTLERKPVPKITAASAVEDVLATGLITPPRILSPAKEASALQKLLTYLKGEGGFLQLPELNLRPLEAAAAKLESLVQRIGSAMQRLRAALGGLGEGGFAKIGRTPPPIFSLQPAGPKLTTGTVLYDILRNQQYLGTMVASITGYKAHIDDIVASKIPGQLPVTREEVLDAANVIGFRGIRQLLQDFLARHPQVTEISGLRVSGTRAGPAAIEGRDRNVLVPVQSVRPASTTILAPPSTIPLAAELPAPVQVPLIPPIPARLALPPFVEAAPTAVPPKFSLQPSAPKPTIFRGITIPQTGPPVPGKTYYDILRDQEIIGKLFATIQGSEASDAFIKVRKKEDYPGIGGIRQLRQDFLAKHPEVTEITGIRIAGSRVGPAAIGKGYAPEVSFEGNQPPPPATALVRVPLQIPAVTTARHSEFGQVLAEQRATIGRLQQSASRVLGPGALPPIVLPAETEEATGGKVKGVLDEQRGVLERLRQTLADESGFARVSKSPLKGAALQTRAASLLRKEYGKFEGEGAAEYTIGRATPFLAEELELPKVKARSLLDRLIASKQVPSPAEVRTGLVKARAEAAAAKRAAEAQVLEEFNQARGVAGVQQTPLLDVETRTGAATGYAGGRRKIPQAAAAEAAQEVIQGSKLRPGETITKIADKGFEVTGARALPPIPPDQPTLRDLSGTTALSNIADQIRDERGRFIANLGKATQGIGTDFTKAFPSEPLAPGEEAAVTQAAKLNVQRLNNLRKVFKPADTRADFAQVFPIPQATLAAAAVQTTDETALVNQLLARQEAQLVAGATKVQSPFGVPTSTPRGAGGTGFYSPTLGAGTAPPIIPPQFVSKPGTAMQLYINRTPVLGIAPPSAPPPPPPGGGPSFFGYPLGGGGPQFGAGAQAGPTFFGQPLGGGFGGGPNPPKPPGFFSRLFGRGGGEEKPPATSKFGRRFASLGYFTAASAVIYPVASAILESGRDAVALELILKRIQAVYGNHTLGEQLEIKGAVLDSAQKFGLHYKQVAEAAELFAREQVPFDELASDLGAAAVGARAFGLNLNEVANYIIAIRNSTHGKVTGEQAINTVAALAVKGAVPPQELIHSIEQLTPLIESEFSPNQGPITDQALIGALTSVGVRQARLTSGQVTNALRFTFSRFGSEESARKIEEISGVQLGTLASSGQELRPLIDILSDLSVAYNNLLATGQSAKAESLIRYLFGARQVGPGTILLKEFAEVMGLAGDATIRTGDAARLAEAQMDSLQARFVVLRNTLTETFSTALADIKPALTGVIDILTAMAQSLGTTVTGWKLLHDAISNTPLPAWAQGAVTGAIPGALIGTVVGGPGVGTLGGAAVGGVIGSANSLPLPKWVKRGLIGGAIGSVVPGIGTVFGAGAGAVLGIGTSLLEENEPAQIPVDRAKLRAQALATRFGVTQENLSAAVHRAVQAASATGIAPEQQQGVFTQALSTLLPGIGPNLQAGGLDYIQQVLTNVAAATPDDAKARQLTTFAQGLSKVAVAALDLGTAVESFLEHSSKLEKAAKVDEEFFAAVGASGVTARERLNATLKIIREGYELTPNRVLVNGQAAVTGAVPFGDVFQEAAKQYGVDPDLLTAIAARESGFNPTLVHLNRNKTKDYGIGQINDTNFESLGLTAETALDPKVAIPAMARFIANLQKQLGPDATVEDVASAYNAGRTPAGKPRYTTPLKGVNQQGQPIEIPQYVNQPYVAGVVGQRSYYKSVAAQVDVLPVLENFSKTFPFGSQKFFSSLQQTQQPVTTPTPEAQRLQQEQLVRLRAALKDLVKSRQLALATGQDEAADRFLAQFKATGEAYREAALPPLAPIPVSTSVVFQKGQRSAPGVEQAQDKNLVLEAQREEETYQQEIAPAFQKLAIFRLGLEEKTQRELLNIKLRSERRIGRVTKQPEEVQLQEQLEAIAERRAGGAAEILQYEREQEVVIQERAQIEHLLPVDIRKAYTELDIEVTKRKEELAATLKVAEATARIAFYEQVITKNLKERDAYLKGIVDTTVRALGNLPHAIEEHKGLGGLLGSIITPIGEDIYKQNLGRVNLETIRTAFPGTTRGIENVLFGGPSIAERIEAAKKERQDLSDLTFGAVPAKLTDQEITTLTQKYAKESARDQLILAGAQFVGATAGAALGGHAQGATVGSSVGGLVGAGVGSIIPGIGTVVGGAVGSVLGGLIGGFFGKPKPPPETGDLKIIAQNTGDQVKLLENTNQLLAKNLVSFNVPTGFRLPSYQPSLFGGVAVQRGGGGNTVNNLVKVDVTVDGNNLNSNAIGSSIAQAISDRLELESRSAGTYNSRLVYG